MRAIPTLVVFPIVMWLLVAATVFGYLGLKIRREGGKVDTLAFKNTDLWVCAGLITYLVLIISSSFNGPQHVVTDSQIVHSGEFNIDVILLLGAFMAWRGINPLRQFGVTRMNPFQCAAIAFGLVFCVHAFTTLVEFLTVSAMHGKAETQNVIEFFLDAAEHSDRKAMLLTGVLAVVVAPLAEETIFRGYLYGVLKRYLGGIGAGVLTAGLFAAIHLDLAALPALFVLALCLTLAYEATGSLLVNIFMHSLFNLVSLLVILWTARPS